jgi:hypothetical protein
VIRIFISVRREFMETSIGSRFSSSIESMESRAIPGVFVTLERMARDVINDAADVGECRCADII